MNRRQFLETVAVGLVAAPALASPSTAKLPQRLLGRTGLKVPILGFGSGSRFVGRRQTVDPKNGTWD